MGEYLERCPACNSPRIFRNGHVEYDSDHKAAKIVIEASPRRKCRDCGQDWFVTGELAKGYDMPVYRPKRDNK